MTLTQEQRLVLDAVRRVAREVLYPLAPEYDRKAEYPWPQLKALAELGLLGMTTPEEWGGVGLDSVTWALALEELAAADPSVAVIVSVTSGLPQYMLLRFGSEAQKRRYLVPLARGVDRGLLPHRAPGGLRRQKPPRRGAAGQGRVRAERGQELDHLRWPRPPLRGHGPHGEGDQRLLGGEGYSRAFLRPPRGEDGPPRGPHRRGAPSRRSSSPRRTFSGRRGGAWPMPLRAWTRGAWGWRPRRWASPAGPLRSPRPTPRSGSSSGRS